MNGTPGSIHPTHDCWTVMNGAPGGIRPTHDGGAVMGGHLAGLFRCYQTRQLSVGAIGEPFLQLKAAANPGWLTMAPLARKWSGEWGSVRTWLRTCSGRVFSQ